jgi:hypothetical protein
MALWVVLVVLLIDGTDRASPVALGIADGVTIVAFILLEAWFRRRRHQAQAPTKQEQAVPAWASSPLIGRPTSLQLRRHAGMPPAHRPVRAQGTLRSRLIVHDHDAEIVYTLSRKSSEGHTRPF